MLLTTVSTIYIVSSAVILQCLTDLYQEDSQKNIIFLEQIILKTPKLKDPFQTPGPPICDRPDDTNYVIDHTYALPIAAEPYIIYNEPFSIYFEIEVDTEVDAVQNEVLFDYNPSHDLILFHSAIVGS